MVKMFKILFINCMVIGTLMAISAYSWFTSWIGLEMNLLSIIPLLKNSENKYPSESALKYFIVQVMASSLLLFSVEIYMIMHETMTEDPNLPESIMIGSALLLKMGAAPLHFWLPELLEGLKWSNIFIMLTLQKIAPMILLANLMKPNSLFFSIAIILSSMISGLQGMNQISMKKILAYSSINHVGWMISTLLNFTNIWTFYFIIYSLINGNIMIIMNKFNITFINQLIYMFTYKKKIKFLFMLNFLSLGGLPPFLGFLPKWLTINNMINEKHYLLTVMLIIFTLISLYMYMRITFSSFSINTEESLIILFNKINFFHFMINLFSLMGLIACSLMDSTF